MYGNRKLPAQCSRCLLLLLVALPLRAQISVSAAMAAKSRSGRGSAPSLHTADVGADTAAPPTTLEAALRNSFDRSAVIFAGEVLSVEREASAIVIRWQVLDAIRGVDAGVVYALREWPGLWEANASRYLPGQRALLLLHAPSVAGYASPVGGSEGVIPLRGDVAGSVLDLSLLAQRVLVTDAARLRPAEALRLAGGSLAESDALQARSAALASNVAAARQRALPQRRAPALEEVSSITIVVAQSAVSANNRVDGTVVLGMLHAWQRTGTGAQ